MRRDLDLSFLFFCFLSLNIDIVGVAFSLLARILEECSTIHSLPALCFFVFFVESWDLLMYTSSTLQTWISPQWLSKPEQQHSQPTLTSFGQVYVCLGVTCHLYFWQNDRGLLHATAVTWGWNEHRIRVSTQSWLWRRTFSCCCCQDSNMQPFTHKSGARTNKLTRLPSACVLNSTCVSSMPVTSLATELLS